MQEIEKRAAKRPAISKQYSSFSFNKIRYLFEFNNGEEKKNGEYHVEFEITTASLARRR